MSHPKITLLESVAEKWVKGREADLLRARVYQSIHDFQESPDFDPSYEDDLQTFAEELQIYSTILEEVPLSILISLIEEFLEDNPY